jgi:hypothetical protein
MLTEMRSSRVFVNQYIMHLALCCRALLYMTVDRWFNAHHNAQHIALYPSKMVTKS